MTRASPRRGCHDCPVRPTPGTPYEKTPCAKCKKADTLLQTTRGVFLTYKPEMYEPIPHQPPEPIDPEKIPYEELISKFMAFLAHISQLPPAAILGVFGKMSGKTLKEIAKDAGCSPANVRQVTKRATENVPYLKTLFTQERITRARFEAKLTAHKRGGTTKRPPDE
jgi:AraC-like DNA-binding protein